MSGAVTAVAPVGVLFILLIIGRWVYVDAKAHAERGAPVVFSSGTFTVDTPVAWAVGCVLLWVVFLPLYARSRG
jgi:hypothetical protein